MKQSERERLMRKYDIKEVGGNRFGDGFFHAVKYLDEKRSKELNLIRNTVRDAFRQKVVNISWDAHQWDEWERMVFGDDI